MNKSYILLHIYYHLYCFFCKRNFESIKIRFTIYLNDLFEGFNPTHEAYEKCGQMSDCNTCLTTMTRGD